jgi:hypothetical protein
LSHENLSDQEILGHVANYEQRFQLPTTDVLRHGCRKLVQALCKQFPELRLKIKRTHVEKNRALAA